MRRVSPRTRLRQLQHRASLYIRGGRSTAARKLFVFSEPRVGSNLFIDYLNSLPGVVAEEEILNPWSPIGLPRRASRRATMRHIERSMVHDCKIVACKLMLHHLDWHNIEPADLLRTYPRSLGVVLYRENLLRQFVSNRILRATGVDRVKEPWRFGGTVKVDPAELSEFCSSTQDRYKRAISADPSGTRLLAVSYESLTSDPQSTFRDRVCPFVGVPYRPVRTDLQKQNPQGLEKLIDNWSELSKIIPPGIESFDPRREHDGGGQNALS